MADTNGNTPDSLTERLAKRPFAFDFYRAVRLLESQHPELPRIGFSASPTEDPVRFWQNPSLRFAPSALDSFGPGGPDGPPRMAVNFFGLFGPNAPMPPHITEYVLEREMHHHDFTITAFFNVFHHRMISLFYRAWAASQRSLDMDRPDDQRFTTYIGSLFGIGMDTLQQRDAVPDNAKLFFTGRLANQTRNSEGLESILRDYFNLPVRVDPFVGRWLDLPADSICCLGSSTAGRDGRVGANRRMGDWAEGSSFGDFTGDGGPGEPDANGQLRGRAGDAGFGRSGAGGGSGGSAAGGYAAGRTGGGGFGGPGAGGGAGGSAAGGYSAGGPGGMDFGGLGSGGGPGGGFATSGQFVGGAGGAAHGRAAGGRGGMSGLAKTGRLGIDTILGSQFWDCQLSFKMRFGPMGLADYERMLPHGESFKRLKYWLMNYCGDHFFWTAQLVLLAGEVPRTSLGRGSRVGWTTWLKTKDFAHDADDLILNPPKD